MKVDELEIGMIVRCPEDGFDGDNAEVLDIDHNEGKVYFHDVDGEFDFDYTFEEVERIVKPLDQRLGAASILIELKDDTITVSHGTDGTLLKSFPADENSWKTIWTGIDNANK